MKRSILLILGFIAGIIPAFAQMSADSTTVQVVAYWQVGDKYTYQVEESRYKVDNGTDTTDVQRSAYLMTFEVVDATDTTYRVRVKSDDYQHSDYGMSALMDEISMNGNIPHEFETDEYGAFKRIIISEEDFQNFKDAMNLAVDRMTEGKEGMTDEVREATRTLVQDLLTREKIEQLYTAEFKFLIQYHGLWMKIGAEVPYETETPSLFGNGENIKVNGRFWADEELTDDYSVVIRKEEEIDEGDMLKMVQSLLAKTLDSLSPMADEEAMKEAKEEMGKIFDNMKMDMKTSSFEEIHLYTGWPIYYEFENSTLVKVADMEQRQFLSQSVSLLLENEDE